MKLLGFICALFACCSVFADGELLYKQGLELYETEPDLAYFLFIQATERGSVPAMVGAGNCQENGVGTKVNYAGAIKWYEQVMELEPSVEACSGLIRIYASCRNPKFHNSERALHYAEMLLKKDPYDGEALALASSAFARDVNIEKAIYLCGRASKYAADIKSAKKYNQWLAQYKKGKPVPAVATDEWMDAAADAGLEWAVVIMARRCLDPSSGKYNKARALKLFNVAIKKGRKELYLERGRLLLDDCKLALAYKDFAQASNYKETLSCLNPVELRLYKYLTKPPSKVYERAEELNSERLKKEFYTERETRSEYDPYLRRTVEKVEFITKSRMVRVPPDFEGANFLFMVAGKMGHPQAQHYVKKSPPAKPKHPKKKKAPKKSDPAKRTPSGLPIPTY